MGPEVLVGLLAKMHSWQPFDGDALLDDVAAALDDVAPEAEDIGELTARLSRHLVQLVHIAAAVQAERPDECIARLLAWARPLADAELPADRRESVGHVRRIGWAVDGLLERLVETRSLRAAA